MKKLFDLNKLIENIELYDSDIKFEGLMFKNNSSDIDKYGWFTIDNIDDYWVDEKGVC